MEPWYMNHVLLLPKYLLESISSHTQKKMGADIMIKAILENKDNLISANGNTPGTQGIQS